MQTTLLGLAIAIILALLAALVGPLLVDWGGHRSLFEAQASRLIGLDVRVTGEIDARLLPSPRITMHAIEIGGGSDDKIRARALGIEFALGPLMRGEWRAADMHLVGPQLKLGLDVSGHLQAPNLSIRFSPDTISIDRLSIEDGTLTLADAANGAGMTLEHLWFNGEARSLLGPLKGEGAATVGGELYPFRIAAGRYTDDGTLKLHVNVDPVNHPLSIEADGMLTLAGRAPHFDGSLSLTRPVGIAGRGSAQPVQSLTQPWRVSGKVKAGAASALMEAVEFQYGSEEQGFKLTGVADFKFGKQPRFDGVLSGRQIDLDRALADGGGTRPPPAAAIRKIAELAAGAFRPSIPIQIGVGIDQVTLGGNTVSNLRGDVTSDAKGWNLDSFEFRAPGITQVKLNGHLAVGAGGVNFRGPAEVRAGDPKTLAAWLQGRVDSTKSDRLRPLNLRGEVTLASDKLAVERLSAEFDRKTVTGRFVYAFAGNDGQAKLDAELNTPELDIDAALGFGQAIFFGSNLSRPQDMTVAADIGRATLAGIEACEARVRVTINADGLQIDRLSVADLGGGAFTASGKIDTGGHAPRGALTVDFETRETAAIAALAAKFAPKKLSPLTGLLDRAAHAKLHATLDVAGDKDNGALTIAKLAVTGDVDAMRLDTRARVTGDWAKPTAADLRIDGTIEAPNGATLIKLMGLDRIVATGGGPGEFKLLVTGPADQDMQIDWRLRAGGLRAQSLGRGHISLDKGLTLTSTIHLAGANVRSLRPAGAAGETLPLSLNARVAVAGRSVSFNDIAAKLRGGAIRGHLSVDDGGSSRRIDGALETDSLDIAALIANATAMPAAASREGAAWTWSSETFGAGAFGQYAGQIALKARSVDLLPRLAAREFRATLRLGKDEFVFDDLAADLAGGKFAGQITLRAAEDGLSARAKISLTKADAAALLPAGARPPVSGAFNLSAEVASTGLSPVALIGSLQGSGKFVLADAQLAGLDPRAFDAVIHAVDQGLPVDSGRISEIVTKALDSGQLAINRAEGTLAVSAGQVRLSNVTADSKEAKLSLAGTVDLTDGSIDARLLLSGSSKNANARPDIFMALKGPVTAPSRSIDVSALTGWLTLRAIENQAKQLRAIERATPKPSAPARKKEAAPALPPPVNIKPLPAPARGGPPEASAGSQR